ncbi:MAG: ABC transporter permease [Acidobacteriota bacterium]|nr:ABC transporter permease [Acidobacteriota bacterium]
MTSPSPFAERVLAIVVRDPEGRDAVIGDLREEHTKLSARVGAARARRWHTQQSLRIACRYGTHRLLRRGTPPRRWLAIAAQEPGGSWTAGLSRDALYAWRAVAQRPALSGVIVLTLALALAANATTFSLMDAIVLRPYRFDGVNRLIAVASSVPGAPFYDRETVTRADFRDWQRDAKSVEQLAAFEWWQPNLSGIDNPEQVPGFKVTAEFFDLLGVSPRLGRTFLAEESEPGRHQRVVLGHELWTRRFAADPAIVGRTVRLDGEPYEVVGVAPEGFNIPLGAQAWAPISYDAAAWDDRRDTSLTVIGRLADGGSIDNARAEMSTIGERQRTAYPETNATRDVTVTTFALGMNDPGAGPMIGTWQAATGLLLLIACANIANLLLARGGERAQEFAVRLALGASRARLFWQTILEGLTLAALAVAASVPLAWVGLGLSRRSIPESVIRFVPGWQYIQIDFRLLAITALLATVAMLLFSIVPALQATGTEVGDQLRQSGRSLTPGRRRNRTRFVLAVAQVSLTLAVLFGSGLMLSAADTAANGATGFDKHNVLIAQVDLPERSYQDAEGRRRFITRVLESMRAIPAVTESAFTSHIPYGNANTDREFRPEGEDVREGEVRRAAYRRNSADYFAAMRIPLVRGRLFNDGDRADSTPVAMVSHSLAQQQWPGEDPIGRRFKIAATGEWITVVGVVGDVVHSWFLRPVDRTVYRPLSQEVPFRAVFTFRTVGDPMALAGDVRRAVAAADPDLPIAQLLSMERLMENNLAGLSFIASSLGIVALIAFTLAVMGIYSLMAYLTSQRTQEIGVRMALGASWWQVVRLTTAQALKITVAGLILGAALSFALGRLMQSVLFGIVSTNLLQLAALVIGLAAAALVAAYLPARRAARLDPTIALREY